MVSTKTSCVAVRAITLLWISSLAAAGSAFVAQVLLSRYLGPASYGSLSAALATVVLFSPLATFGVGTYWLRVFGLEGWGGRRWFVPSLKFVAISSAVTCLVLVIWSRFGSQGTATRLLVLWLCPLVVSQALIDLVSGRFQLEERYRSLALWQAVTPASRCVVIALAIGLGAGLGFIVVGFAIVALLLAAIAAVILMRAINGCFFLAGHRTESHSPDPSSPPHLRDVLAGAWPFALAGVFYLVYFQSGVILLEWMMGPVSAAVYNVAFTVMAGIYLLPGVIYQKYLMPKLCRWAEHDRRRFLAIYRFGNGSMLALGCAIMVLLMLAIPVAVPLLFGARYAAAKGVLFVLALCVPVRFLATSVGGTLVTESHMRRKVWYQSAVALVNVSLNLILIPRFSYYGAATTTVVSEILLLTLYLAGNRRYVFGEDALHGWNLNIRSLEG